MCDGRHIPCAVIEWLEAGDFAKRGGRGFDNGNSTIFGLNEKFILPEQNLSEAISAAFPKPLSGCGVDAGEDTVIKSVDKLIV